MREMELKMINYGEIRERTDSFLQTREGLAQPKIQQDYDIFCSELAVTSIIAIPTGMKIMN